jgi:hypothetical protein
VGSSRTPGQTSTPRARLESRTNVPSPAVAEMNSQNFFEVHQDHEPAARPVSIPASRNANVPASVTS